MMEILTSDAFDSILSGIISEKGADSASFMNFPMSRADAVQERPCREGFGDSPDVLLSVSSGG